MNPSASSGDALELRDARETEQLGTYLTGMWARREYMWWVAKSELRSRQINSVLGNLWHVLNPLLQIAVFFLFFGLVLKTDRGTDNFLGYLSIGIFVYSYTQKSAMSGGKSLAKYRGLIQIVTFPRATLPITTTMTETLATLSPYLVMFIVALSTGETPELSWFLVIPFMAIQAVFNAGLALVVARAVNHLADIQQVLPIIFRLGFYFSGVLCNVEAYIDGRSYETLFRLNPLYCFLEINRGAILGGTDLDWALVLTAAIWALVAIVFGLWWFRKAEDSYGEA